jgi:protein-S-isoprenylcysteine O-methyltransferase Ste14
LSRTRREALHDVLLGLSVGGWAVMGFVQAAPAERFTPARLAVCALNAFVGALFVARTPVSAMASPAALATALPSMLLGAAALRLAPSPSVWARPASALFVGGAVLAVVALVTLGKSFAFLPARRPAVTRGVYRLVRHPAYAGELLMIVACGVAVGFIEALVAATAGALALVPRILAEEQLLSTDPSWSAYRNVTRWRILPGVW